MMKRFVKGALETVVEDDDRRIKDYIAGGWKAAELTIKPQDDKSKQMNKAIFDANDSEVASAGKNNASDKKVNDAIKANAVAIAESEEVDDGLIKKEEDKVNGRGKRR